MYYNGYSGGDTMRHEGVKRVALGGLLAAVAVVIMCLGGLIPIATFVCPVLCILLCGTVYRFCGHRITWAWYGAVAVLSLLLGPDKEAAAIFCFLGHYPILKSLFERTKLRWLFKLLYFNGAITIMYAMLIYVLGMEQIIREYAQLGMIGLGVILILGNVTFVLLDRLLTLFSKKGRRYGK